MAGPARHPDDWALRPFSSKPQKTKPHIPSSFLWTHLLFLLMGLGASGKDPTPTVVPGILGRSVTFPLNISVDTEFEHVTWNGPRGALALATAEGKIFFMVKSYQDRLTISWNSFSLSLSNLTLEDAGSYKAQINRKTSTFTTDKEFMLHVYEQVPEPQVIMKSVNMSDSGSCNITLICFVERAGTSVLYSWTLRDAQASESHEGSTFIIHWRLCDPDLPYTCTARNPVSQNTSSPVHARQFCTDPGASRGESMGEMVVGILGESVTLPLTLSASHSGENVIWMFNTSIISKEQKEAATADPFIKFRDPNKNSSQDYSLMIGQLKMENAGHYYAYVCSKASGVISTKHITLLVYGPERNTELYIGLSLMASILCFGIFIWCIWKRKRPCSDPASNSSHAETPTDAPGITADHPLCNMLSQGYQKLDTFPKTAKQEHSPTSESSETTEKNQERTGRAKARRHQEHDLLTQESTGSDSSSEGQAEYDLITPESKVPASVDNTVYTQVFLNLQGKTPVPEQKESSATIYSCVQTSQKVMPPPQQDDLESPESPTYENFSCREKQLLPLSL
ncbi:T-lymphocyte surface antigen Ly-9 isoform X3 [Neomonachus schauinslandi]|uniref:T-lymphocyte surface antigen Ly-9 isoform X3 n=1 Tax=Neomonachus schauinslandi TaxID=29088 RepID=A0A8M1MHX8_NEOSC|nr:T-lymphocyte surface antigen Ly-9 isoform X3 [Neomonachus schauinslandi]